MVLDVGTRVGLIALKLLWQNENFYSIGIDRSGPMIEHARATAEAWELGEPRGFPGRRCPEDAIQDRIFRPGRFPTRRYIDLTMPPRSLREIQRVLKPKGALLIRDFRRPNRFRMSQHIAGTCRARFGECHASPD